MARFYALSIEETLFGQARLARRWVPIGTIGRTVQHSFDDEGEAVGLFLELLRAKRNRGCRPSQLLGMQRRSRHADVAEDVMPCSRARSARRHGTLAAQTSKQGHGRAVRPVHRAARGEVRATRDISRVLLA